jgi:hypothetical protein
MEMEWDARLHCHTRDDCVVKADWARAAVEEEWRLLRSEAWRVVGWMEVN